MALWNHCFWSRLICGAQRLRFNQCDFLINNLLQALAAVPLCLSDYLRNLSAIETTACPPVTLTAPRDNRRWFTTLRLPARWGSRTRLTALLRQLRQESCRLAFNRNGNADHHLLASISIIELRARTPQYVVCHSARSKRALHMHSRRHSCLTDLQDLQGFN